MVFLTVECASRIQYPELWISFSVIPFLLWAAILWWCFISKGPVTFPTFGDNIGCLHSFKNEFSNLPPTWITSSPSKNGSKREILLLLSSALFKSLEFFKDFNHQKSSLKLCCCIIFTNFVFASCSKLVFSRVTPFTFLMMSGWYTLHALWQDTTNSFLFIEWRYYVVISTCLWFPKKLWSKLPPFNFIIITNINPSWCIICWVLFWTDIMLLGFIWMIFDEFNYVCHKYLEPLWFILNVAQNNLTISPEYFFIDWNF